ncbi:MAG: hypothetical protein EOO73_34760 [Myxococcales bacterium]|nr:MAG: hypothetical protein EOO73_34760 [Myxococcales bacterium]
MIPATIEQWARSAPPGARRYRVHADGRTVLYSSTFDGLGQQFAAYPTATAACWAIDQEDIAWRLDLRQARAEKVPA